jgi:hypothetical protein
LLFWAVLVSRPPAQFREVFASLFSKSGLFTCCAAAHAAGTALKKKGKTTFCEQKVAKKLCSSRPCWFHGHRPKRSFCAAFFKKPPLYLLCSSACSRHGTEEEEKDYFL